MQIAVGSVAEQVNRNQLASVVALLAPVVGAVVQQVNRDHIHFQVMALSSMLRLDILIVNAVTPTYRVDVAVGRVVDEVNRNQLASVVVVLAPVAGLVVDEVNRNQLASVVVVLAPIAGLVVDEVNRNQLPSVVVVLAPVVGSVAQHLSRDHIRPQALASMLRLDTLIVKAVTPIYRVDAAEADPSRRKAKIATLPLDNNDAGHRYVVSIDVAIPLLTSCKSRRHNNMFLRAH